jgi:hypothetical protein
MAEISIKNDNGIVALILGGLLVWLWFKFHGTGLAGLSTNTTTGIPSCGAPKNLVSLPVISEGFDTSGRFIPGFSGGAAGRGAPIANPVNTSYGFHYGNQYTGIANEPFAIP